MNKLHFATTNEWKLNRAREYFSKFGITLESFPIELPESRSDDVLEVAKEKAELAYCKLKKPVFVLDAGFYIKALNGFPATYVKFAEKFLGSERIIKLMKGVKDRTWEFPHAICFKDQKTENVFVGTIKGVITKKMSKVRENKFGRFNDIMKPTGYKKCFAEMTETELKEFDEKVWNPTVYDNFIDWFKNYQPK